MIAEDDIRSGLFSLMNTRWKESDGFHYYFKETDENYILPCFFIDVRLDQQSQAGLNMIKKHYNIRLLYLHETLNEAAATEKTTGLMELFLSTGKSSRVPLFNVNDAYLEVKNYSYTYIGRRATLPEIAFELDFFDSYSKEDTETPIMEELTIRQVIRDMIERNKN